MHYIVSMYKRYFWLFLVVVCSCATKHTERKLKDIIKANSTPLNLSLLKVESKKIYQLPEADTAIVTILKKFQVLEPDHKEENSGCVNKLHYYGYLQLNRGFMGAVFGYSVCSCCGDDRLILAIIDTNNIVVSATMAAQMLNASECAMETTTQIKGGKLIIARKDECGILEGPNEGQSSIDSSTMYYTIGNDGKLVLESSDSLKLVR